MAKKKTRVVVLGAILGATLLGCALPLTIFGVRNWEQRNALASTPPPSPTPLTPVRRSTCDEAGDLLNAGRPWDAVALAERCGDDLQIARMRWMLGDFLEASLAFTRARVKAPDLAPSPSEVEAHVIAGDRQEAAKILVALAPKQLDSIRRQSIRELADALVAEGDLTETPIFLTLAEKAPYPANVMWKALLGRERPITDPLQLNIDNRWDPSWTRSWPIALEARALAAQPRPNGTADDERFMASYAVRLGLYDAYLGERTEALRLISSHIPTLELKRDRALKDGTANVDEWRKLLIDHEILQGATVVALEADALPMVRDLEAYRRTLDAPKFPPVDLDEDVAFALDPSATKLATLWPKSYLNNYFVVGARGDGAALAKLLGTGGDAYLVMPRVVPFIRTHGAQLGSWAEHLPPPCWTCGLGALMGNTAARRQAARTLGMMPMEAVLGDVARKILAVELDVKVASALFACGRVEN